MKAFILWSHHRRAVNVQVVCFLIPWFTRCLSWICTKLQLRPSANKRPVDSCVSKTFLIWSRRLPRITRSWAQQCCEENTNLHLVICWAYWNTFKACRLEKYNALPISGYPRMSTKLRLVILSQTAGAIWSSHLEVTVCCNNAASCIITDSSATDIWHCNLCCVCKL